MKTWLAIIITGLGISAPLLAQESEKPKTPQGTKIAVVNVQRVFDEYWKAKQFKADLEESLLPYKAKAKKLADQVKMWKDDLNVGKVRPEQRNEYLDAIKQNRRDLEEFSAMIQKDLGAKQEQNLVILWKEINEGIAAVAKAQGYQLVLGYNTPPNPETLSFQSRKQPRFQALDLGGLVPLYMDESIDITNIVIYNFNAGRREPKKSPSN